ncbi:MAG: hypothetical protein KJZ83_02295 [Burkholderiaceae bacterium]|nr:hypothetical protein [Burkholderiaceae bacterium]
MIPRRTERLGEALQRQREAIVSFDSQALLEASEEVLRTLATLRACKPALSDEEVDVLRAAQSALRANATVLHQANAANVRGLSALLDAPALYASSGAANASRSSRTIDAA